MMTPVRYALMILGALVVICLLATIVRAQVPCADCPTPTVTPGPPGRTPAGTVTPTQTGVTPTITPTPQPSPLADCSAAMVLYRLNNSWTDTGTGDSANTLTAVSGPTFDATNKQEGSHAANFVRASGQYAKCALATCTTLNPDGTSFSMGCWGRQASLANRLTMIE